MKYRIYILICLAIFPFLLCAQTEKVQKESDTSNDFSMVQFAIGYSSDALFMGRKDSIRAPYLMPSIGYHAKSGFFADASLSYLTAKEEQRIDLVLLSTGYLFEKEDFSFGIMGVKYFYDKESYNVLTEVEGAILGLVGYDLNIVETSVQLSSYINKNGSPDFFAGLIAERSFYSNNQKFLINPSITLNAGTQNFYEAYYRSSRLGNRKGKSDHNSNVNDSEKIQIQEVSKFNLLSIEFSLPMYLNINNFVFTLEPVYVIPQNPATIDTGDTFFEEQLDNTLYWNISVSYLLELNNS